MKDVVHVALAQLDVAPLDPATNLARVVDACNQAAAQDAELVLFPELVNVGQVPSFDEDFALRYVAAAESAQGDFLRSIGEVAAELGIYIAIGFAEADPVVPQTIYNAAALVDEAGSVVGMQRKLHLPGEERHYFARGDEVEVFSTDLGRLGIQICYDLYFPEVARLAALRGAEVLCGLANIPLRLDWPDRLRQLACVRAYENMQHVVLVNRVGSQHGYVYGGESVAASPPGRVLAEAPQAEPALVTATLSSERLVAERVRRPVFADRRQDVYGSLRPDSMTTPGADARSCL